MTQQNTTSNRGQVGTDGSGALSGLKDKLASATGSAREQISSAASAAKDQVAEAIEPMKDKAMEMAEEGRKSGATEVGRVAKAVHAVADEIGKEIPQAAGYVHSAAKGLEEASAAIQNRNVGEIVEFVEDFARRNPAAFFGTSVLAGFVFSRFLKSSAERQARTPRSMGAGDA
jgi:hypothetical protein